MWLGGRTAGMRVGPERGPTCAYVKMYLFEGVHRMPAGPTVEVAVVGTRWKFVG